MLPLMTEAHFNLRQKMPNNGLKPRLSQDTLFRGYTWYFTMKHNKNFRYIYFAQLKYPQEDTDF